MSATCLFETVKVCWTACVHEYYIKSLVTFEQNKHVPHVSYCKCPVELVAFDMNEPNVETVKRNMSSVGVVCLASLRVRPVSFCPLAPVSSSSPVSEPPQPV